MAWVAVVVLILVAAILAASLKVIPEYERAVHFRLGRLTGARGPGLILVVPIIDRIARVSLRTVALEIPQQELVTKDNVTVRVNGVTYYRVRDAVRAVLEVQNYQFATAQVSQVTLLSVLRQHDLDSVLRERETISAKLRELIDAATEPWGVEVTTVEIKDVELPEQMRRAMAREAESERERRAKVIHARGEYEAAETLGDAAATFEHHPAALQLRTLSTLAEIAVERNSTIVFPLPFELVRLLDGLARQFNVEDMRLTGPIPAPEPPPSSGTGSPAGAGPVESADTVPTPGRSPVSQAPSATPPASVGPDGSG